MNITFIFHETIFWPNFPEFSATGIHGKLIISYILPTPFLNGFLSPNCVLVLEEI